MKHEEHDCVSWPLPDNSALFSLWPSTVGRLVAFGDSQRKLVLPAYIPHFIVKGQGCYDTPYEKRCLRAGQMYSVWPDVPYDLHEDDDDPWTFYWMRLSGPTAGDYIRAMGLRPDALTRDIPDLDLAQRILAGIHDNMRRKSHAAALDVVAGLYALLACFCSDAASRSTRDPQAVMVERALLLMDAFPDRGYNVNDIARELDVCRNTLTLAFKACTGSTAVEYLQRRRIDLAKNILRATDDKIESVARSCGYSNVKYFYRNFKKITGQSPAEYRTAMSES